MVDTARFWNRIAKRYARMRVPDEAAYRRKLEETRAFLGPDMRVLELGCGTGSTAIAHAPHVREVVALDYAEAMVRIAREKAEAAGVRNVRFEVGDAAASELPDGSFDAVLALNLLHLLDDREAAVRRIRALLRPGGAFVSSTPCLADAKGWVRALLPVLRAVGLAPRVAAFAAADLVATVEGAGFAVERRWSHGGAGTLFLIARRPAGAGA